MRLGFACAVMGLDVRAHDTRKWQNNPHLCVSLGNVSQILRYAHGLGIRMYRLSSNIAPYYTDLNRPQFGNQLQEARADLEHVGALARELDIRLSMHPGQYTVLNSPTLITYEAAIRELRYASDVLDIMGMPPGNKVIIHLGGAYGDKAPALERWMERYPLLPHNMRERLVIENDDTIFNVADALFVSERVGVPIIFDNLHHRVNPSPLPDGQGNMGETEALRRCLQTWPAGQLPKTHYSDQRTGEVQVRVKGKGTRMQAAAVGSHADYIDPAEFVAYIERAGDLHFDVMFEAKAKELAAVRVMDYMRAVGLGQLLLE